MYQSNGGLAGAVPGGSRRFRGNAGPHIAAGMFHQIFRLHRAAIRYASKFMSIAAPWSPIENHPPANVNRSVPRNIASLIITDCFIAPPTIFNLPLPINDIKRKRKLVTVFSSLFLFSNSNHSIFRFVSESDFREKVFRFGGNRWNTRLLSVDRFNPAASSTNVEDSQSLRPRLASCSSYPHGAKRSQA